ncbi:MAG: hypothetical protein WD069_20505 [Planctomycetales bacterium]
MPGRTLLECAFLIPISRDRNLSDGRLHSVDVWRWLEEELWARFRGASRALVLYEGFYADPDTGGRVDDRSRKYEVALERKQIPELRDLLTETCLRFHQKSIYLSIAGKVEFIEQPPE